MNELMYLYVHIDILIIITARILACLAFLPIIEETRLPRPALAGLSLCLAIAVYFNIDVAATYYKANLFSFALIIIKETLVGLILGFIVKLFFQIYLFMGSLLSMQGGISMSTVMDPSSGTQSTLVGRIYNLGFIAIFLVSGGYHWFIKTLVDSFTSIPIGQAVFRTSIVQVAIEAMGTYLELGFKLALPIITVIVIIDFAMGIMARTVPQMNMFVIGIPLKMIVMFILMLVTVQVITDYNQILIEAMIDALMNMLQGMRPL